MKNMSGRNSSAIDLTSSTLNKIKTIVNIIIPVKPIQKAWLGLIFILLVIVVLGSASTSGSWRRFLHFFIFMAYNSLNFFSDLWQCYTKLYLYLPEMESIFSYQAFYK